jgi:hypothetical protein
MIPMTIPATLTMILWMIQRSYPDDDDDPDQDGDDDPEDDFSKPKVLSSVMLLEKLESEAEQRYYAKRRLTARQQRIKAAPTKLEQKSEKLMEMRRKTAAAEYELRMNRQLELETLRLQKAPGQLYRSNMTDKERKQLKTDTDRMAIAFSTVCPEVHPDWRRMAKEEFENKRL